MQYPTAVTAYICYDYEEEQTEKSKDVTIIEVDSLEPDEGTWFDDGDEDANTNSYAVCVADTGVVTVTATPLPNVLEEDLPPCWSLTADGGIKIDNFTYEIDKTTPAKTVVNCTCNTSKKITIIYIVKVDIDTGGAHIHVNNDDDDNTNMEDREEIGPISGEDDLVAISLSITPTMNVGEASVSGSSVKVWKNFNKGVEATTWDLSTESLPSVVYVEGLAGSTSVGDKELKLSYVVNTSLIHEDTDTVTLCENPTPYEIEIYWKKWYGPQDNFTHKCYNAGWDPDALCQWDGCYTSQDNKFEHAHITEAGDKFPITHQGEIYTAAMSDRWFTANTYEPEGGYELISTSTTTGNCRSYATGRNYWIPGSGMAILLPDDYTPASGTAAEFWTGGNPGSHAIKIHSFYPSGYIHKERQKSQTSGVYEKSYADEEKEAVTGHGFYFWKSN